ncbi:hypothetical protein DXG01_010486 [Tephrocybe rancida]|nr:hypothetical protein DXG01_010486 [Tephrocybe rancida]
MQPGHLAKFHDIRAPREEQEESESDIEVLGPFPVPLSLETNKRTTNTAGARSVKVVKDPDGPLLKSRLHPLFLQKAMEGVSISTTKKPASSSRTVSRASSSTKHRTTSWTSSRKPPSKITKSTSSSSATSADSEPAIDLPAYSYKDYTDPKPCVVYTRDVDETDDLLAGLRPGPVALDMEWCFSRARGAKERRTAVVQVADMAGMIIIVHVSTMPRFPKALQALIEDPSITKLGANIMRARLVTDKLQSIDDGRKLFRDYGIIPKNLLELGVLSAAWDPTHTIKRKVISLAKLTAKHCGKELLKGGERTGNWEVKDLSELQKDYAANDVHSSLEIYRKLRSLSPDPSAGPPAGEDVEWHELKDAGDGQGVGAEMRLQWRRAHNLWHEKGMLLQKMCAEMRVRKEGMLDVGPLKSATVISYVVSALQADPKLPFDVERLRQLVQMEATSWERHRVWIIAAWFRALETQQTAQAQELDGTNNADL